MALLSHQQGIDRSTVQAGSEEQTLAVGLQVIRKGREGLVGGARIVNSHLARHHVKLRVTRKVLEVRSGCRLRSGDNIRVLVVALKQRLGHVSADKQNRRNVLRRVRSLLLQVAHTRSLTRRGNAGHGGIHTHHQRRLGPLPLQQITCPAHGQLQQGITLLDRRAVEIILDPIVEPIDIPENAIARIQVVPVVQIVLKGRIRWRLHQVLQHVLCDRHVHIGPDRIGHRDVIAKLRLTQDAVLVGLVVAGPHDIPATEVGIVGTLNDRIVLHTISLGIHRNTCVVQRHVDHVSIRRPRNRRLERARHTVAGLAMDPLLRRQDRHHVLSRHGLARIHHIARRSRDIQRSLHDPLPNGRVKVLAVLQLDQEVNAVMRGRLPLVDRHPGLAATLRHRSHRRCPRSEHQTVCRILKVRIQHLANCRLHRLTISGKEQLRGDTKGLATCHGREVRRNVAHKRPRTAQTGLAHVVLRDKQGKASHITVLVPIHVEDTELVAIHQVLAVQNVADVKILRRRQPSPGDHRTRSHAQNPAVPHHDQEAALTVGLVRDRVSREDIVRPVCQQVATLQSHRVQEGSPRGLKLHPIALHLGGGQNKLRSLESRQHRGNVPDHRRSDVCLAPVAIDDLQLQLVGRCLLENILKGLGRLGLGLGLREVVANNSVQAGP